MIPTSRSGWSAQAIGPTVAAALLLVTWLGVNAVWGLTSRRDTLVSGWERSLAPLVAWVVTPAVMLGVAVIRTRARREYARATLPAVMLAYLLGVVASRYLIVLLSPDNVIVERSLMLVTAVPILAALALLRVPRRSLPLRFGRWNRRCTLFGKKNGRTWGRTMAWVMVLVIVPVALFTFASRGLPPSWLTYGLPFAFGLSLVNALAEELLFRGLLQRPLIDRLGVPGGIWLQGGFFGIHHWGSSPSVIAGLAMFPILTFLGYAWGRATYETDGLGWSMTFHAALGIAYFSAAL